MQVARLKKYNRYDLYLFLIIISVLYGRYGLVHPSTVLSLCFLPELILNKNLLSFKKTKNVSVFLILWLFYAFISLLWAPKTHETFLGISFLFTDSILFLEIVTFSLKANNPLKTLVIAWVCAFLITSVVALWEIITDHHLQSAKELRDYRQNSLGEQMDKKYAAFTFYNPNTYSCYICFVFPFALYFFFQSKKLIEYIYRVVPVLLIVFIMSQNSSRGGLLTLAVIFCTFIYFKIKDSSLKIKVYVVMWIALLGLFLFLYGEIIFQALIFRLSQKALLEDNARIILMSASWQAFIDSYGFGMGVGSMVQILNQSHENQTIFLYSHNMFMEGLLEYGILFGIGMILFLLKLFLSGIKIQDDKIKSLVLGTVFSFPFYTVINSENLTLTFEWLFFATIFVFSVIGENRSKKRVFLRRANS